MKNKVEITAKEYDKLSSEVVNIKSIDIVQQRKEKALVMKSEIEIIPEESAEPSLPILLKTTESLPKDKTKTSVESGESLRQTVPLKSIEIVPKKKKKSLEKNTESSSQTIFTKTKEIVPKKKKKLTTRKTTEQSLKSMFGKDIEIVPLNEEGKAIMESSKSELYHFPKKLSTSRRRCFICSRQGKRQTSRYMCDICDVGLCVDPCFQIFHINRSFSDKRNKS